RLQQRLGHRQDAFALELGAIAELQLLDFLFERTFRHFTLSGRGIRLYSKRYRTGSEPGCAIGTPWLWLPRSTNMVSASPKQNPAPGSIFGGTMKTTALLAATLAIAAAAAGNPVGAQEVTLKAVTSFAEK